MFCCFVCVQQTPAYEMRISDWSSDVCSSDLRSCWRAVFFFPVLLSPVVVGLIWKWILQRQGLLNFGLYQFGIEPYTWLTDRTWTFAATIGVSLWAHMGFYALILLAGLQAIPKDLYEAAEMDGTRPARVFWRITLPLLAPNLLVVVEIGRAPV